MRKNSERGSSEVGVAILLLLLAVGWIVGAYIGAKICSSFGICGILLGIWFGGAIGVCIVYTPIWLLGTIFGPSF
jgi:hypothetical protein